MAPSLHALMHGTAIKKHGDLAAIAAVGGLSAASAEHTMREAIALGRILEVDGKYMLSPAGHLIVSSEYSRFCAELRANTQFVQAYDRFEVINNELKQLITRWQTLELGGKRVPNDHSDADYDSKIIDQIGDLHERFEPILGAVTQAEPRFAVYAEKLTAALEKAEDGDIDWVSDARTESYHTVWFELHEDLLRVLGREREE